MSAGYTTAELEHDVSSLRTILARLVMIAVREGVAGDLLPYLAATRDLMAEADQILRRARAARTHATCERCGAEKTADGAPHECPAVGRITVICYGR